MIVIICLLLLLNSISSKGINYYVLAAKNVKGILVLDLSEVYRVQKT